MNFVINFKLCKMMNVETPYRNIRGLADDAVIFEIVISRVTFAGVVEFG